MKLEVGKYYRTRDGRKVGPLLKYDRDYYHEGNTTSYLWRSDGRGCSNVDLIAEWTDEPEKSILSDDTIDYIAIDSLRHHYGKDMEPLEKEAFRIVLRYYGVTV